MCKILLVSISMVIFFITPSVSFGQNRTVDVKSYYEFINKAELAIIDSQYNIAEGCYQKAFELKYPNDKDLSNAFLVSYALRNTKRAKKYIDDLCYKGWNAGYVKDIMSLPDTAFFNTISKNCDSFCKAGKSKDIYEKVSILYSIFKEDQRVRKDDFTDTLEAIKVDNENMEHLGQYIDKYGFPSFEQKGWWLTPEACFNDAYYSTWIVIWHERELTRTPLDKKIEAAVLAGDFRPDYWEAAQLYRPDAVKRYHMRLSDADSSLTTAEIAEINKNRASIYLESLQDFRKKYDAQKRLAGNSPYPFIFLNSFMVDLIGMSEAGVKVW